MFCFLNKLQWDAEAINGLLGPMLMGQDALALKRAIGSSFALLSVGGAGEGDPCAPVDEQ